MPRYALVIGISQYETFRKLPKAATDAEAIAALMEQHGYMVTRLPRKRVGENQWAIDSNKPLAKVTFSQELKEFLRERVVRQEVVIYFAGHGFRVVDSLTDEQMGYWATSDAKSDGQNAIPLDAINTLISKSDLSSLVLMMDCCYAGSLLEQRSLMQPTQDAIGQKQNHCLIAACRDFEKAREGEQHGIFTAAILKGLSIENAKQGEITSTDLFGFVSRELQRSGQEVRHAGKGLSIPLINYGAAISATVSTRIDEICPYQGLKPFTENTQQFFFGRDDVIQQLRQDLEQKNFVGLIGASGSGKSSIVQAGLMPRLREVGWRILEPIKPGFAPIAELKRVLANQFWRRDEIEQVYGLVDKGSLDAVVELLPGSEQVLLVVDQFEEIFTLSGDLPEQEEERCNFIELLTQVESSRLTVLLTMRADFLEPCLSYKDLTQHLQPMVLIPAIDKEALKDSILKPAQKQGYSLEVGLLELILRDVETEENCLPLLQFVLQALWEPATQTKHCLTIAQYERLGGITGALNQHAEQVYGYKDWRGATPHQPRDSAEQKWIKRVCLKLVRTGAYDTRQRQFKADLLTLTGDDLKAKTQLEIALADLVNGRLLVTGGSEERGINNQEQSNKEDREQTFSLLTSAYVDLAHEALMQGWSRFAEWRQESRGIRRLVDRVEDFLQDWQKNQQDGNLMAGSWLIQIQEQWTEVEYFLSAKAKDFFELSISNYVQKFTNSDAERDQLLLREQVAREYAETASRMKDEFLAFLSHELRTPLNPILGWTKLLQTKSFDETTTKRALEIIERNAKLQAQLIQDMLDISRIVHGKLRLDIAPVNIVNIIESAIETVRFAAEAKNIQVQTQLRCDIELVAGDAYRLQQVMWNLLSNSIKFTPSGGKVKIQLERIDSSVQIQVSDTGKGIDQSFLPYVFEVFRQQDGAVTRKFGGLGLGLSIARRVIELHGGDIQAESAGEGQGATFTVVLPFISNRQGGED